MTPPPYLEFDKPSKKPTQPKLEGGEKTKDSEKAKEGEKKQVAKPIPTNHAIFRLPPANWDKKYFQHDSGGVIYLLEDVWIHETIGADNKIIYHYYQEGFDINPVLSWHIFEPKTEIDLNIPAPKPKKDYTPEELADIKKHRQAVMYTIASDDKLFWQFYGNNKYSLDFQGELYQLKINIGTGKVGRIVTLAGFGFMAAAAAPVIIEAAVATPAIALPILKKVSQQGINAAAGLARAIKEAAPTILKDLPKEIITGEVIDKVGNAIGIPLGTIFDFRDAKELVFDFWKFFAKKNTGKLLTPDGKEIDFDSPMLFSKETDPIKGGNLSGGKKTLYRNTDINELKSFKQTEIDAQNPKALSQIEERLLNNDAYLFVEPINTLKTNTGYYILDGHHRIKAAININYKGNIPITELSLDDAKRLFPDKISDIEKGLFD